MSAWKTHDPLSITARPWSAMSRFPTDAEIACRMAKVSADDVMVFAGDRSVQFHGGFGFTWECDSTLFIRRAQWAQQMYGGAIHHRKRLATLLLDT